MKSVMPFVPYVGASVLARAGATRVLVRLHFRTSVDARAYIKPITWRTGHLSPNTRTVECQPAACRSQPGARPEVAGTPEIVAVPGLSGRCERKPAPAGNGCPPGLG